MVDIDIQSTNINYTHLCISIDEKTYKFEKMFDSEICYVSHNVFNLHHIFFSISPTTDLVVISGVVRLFPISDNYFNFVKTVVSSQNFGLVSYDNVENLFLKFCTNKFEDLISFCEIM